MLRAGVFIALLCITSAADAAGQYLEMKFEGTRHRGMGGVDIVIDHTTPANGALGGGLRTTILGLDSYATVSEGFAAYRFGYDLWETSNSTTLSSSEELEALAIQLQDIGTRVKGSEFLLEMHTRVDLLNFNTNRGPWTFQFGLYSEGLAGARWTAPREITFVEDATNSYIDLGEDRTLIRAGARLDNGAAFGIGHAFSFNENLRFSVGARVRAFHRMSLPEHAVSVNAQVHSAADIVIPREINRIQGGGLGLDLFTALHFNDDPTGFRLGAYVEDVVTHVWRGDRNFFVPPRFGVGAAWVSSDGRLTIGTDLERVETFRPKWQPTWQTGLSYTAGSQRVGITPKAGFILNHRHIVSPEVSPVVTAGLEIHGAIVHFGVAGEYHTASGAVNAGVSLKFGY